VSDRVRVPGRLIEAGGEQMHVVERGDAGCATTPLILLHGFPSNSFAWRPVAERLAGRTRSVAIDTVGFGYSTRTPRRGLDPDSHVDRVAAIMDVLGIRQADVAGHSFGGGLAQRFAVRHPDRLRRLVLVAPVDAARRLPLSDRSLLSLFGAMLVPALARRVVARAMRGVASGSGLSADEIAHGYVDPLLLPGTRRVLRRFVRAVAAAEGIDPSRIVAPTLVIVPGSDGIVAPWVQRALAERISGAELAEIGGAGHTVQMERPDDVARLMAAFLSPSPRSGKARRAAGSAAAPR
jgi:pimeloyl-ACP methyl ester carboxylesterase